MAVLLGLDLGEKRVGVAVTDELGMMAVPLLTLERRSRKQILEEIQKISAQYHVSKIVVGLPKTLKGEVGPAAEKILAEVEWFKQQMEKPFICWDERLSTQEVERVLLAADLSRSRRREVRDRLAAQRILQNYLDYQKSTGNSQP